MSQAVFVFYSTESRRSEEFVRQTLAVCESVDGFKFGSPGETVDPADISLDQNSTVELSWQGGAGDVSITFTYKPRPESFLEVFTRREMLLPEGGEGEYEGLTGAVMELVRALAIEHNPYYVMSPDLEKIMGTDPADVTPMKGEFELERIPWFGVYSSSLIEDLGGREHVLETPAWRVEELDTGSILIIRTRTPWADLGRDHPVNRHLLGAVS